MKINHHIATILCFTAVTSWISPALANHPTTRFETGLQKRSHVTARDSHQFRGSDLRRNQTEVESLFRSIESGRDIQRISLEVGSGSTQTGTTPRPQIPALQLRVKLAGDTESHTVAAFALGHETRPNDPTHGYVYWMPSSPLGQRNRAAHAIEAVAQVLTNDHARHVNLPGQMKSMTFQLATTWEGWNVQEVVRDALRTPELVNELPGLQVDQIDAERAWRTLERLAPKVPAIEAIVEFAKRTGFDRQVQITSTNGTLAQITGVLIGDGSSQFIRGGQRISTTETE